MRVRLRRRQLRLPRRAVARIAQVPHPARRPGEGAGRRLRLVLLRRPAPNRERHLPAPRPSRRHGCGHHRVRHPAHRLLRPAGPRPAHREHRERRACHHLRHRREHPRAHMGDRERKRQRVPNPPPQDQPPGQRYVRRDLHIFLRRLDSLRQRRRRGDQPFGQRQLCRTRRRSVGNAHHDGRVRHGAVVRLCREEPRRLLRQRRAAGNHPRRIHRAWREVVSGRLLGRPLAFRSPRPAAPSLG